MQPFLFLLCVRAPRGKAWSQAVLAETVETGDKIGSMTKAIVHKKARSGNINAAELLPRWWATGGGDINNENYDNQ